MIDARPNPTRTALHSETLPDGPLTDRQRAIADAVRFCSDLADFCSAPAEVTTSVHVVTVRLGDDPAFSATRIERGITAARAEINRIENVYRAHGAAAFSPVPEGVPARGLEASDRHGIVVNLLRWCTANGRILVRAGSRPVTRDASGSYCVGEG